MHSKKAIEMSKISAPAEGKPKAGNTKKIVIGLVAVLLLVGGGVGAGLYASNAGLGGAPAKHEDPNRPKLVERSKDHSEKAEGEGGEEGKTVLKVGTVPVTSDNVAIDRKKFEVTYVPIEQAFTANLADGSGFVQVGLSLSTYFDGKVISNLERQMVPVRSAILLVLSDQQAAVISTPQGKQLLQREITKAINQVLREQEGFGGIDNVYFTNLVIQ